MAARTPEDVWEEYDAKMNECDEYEVDSDREFDAAWTEANKTVTLIDRMIGLLPQVQRPAELPGGSPTCVSVNITPLLEEFPI